MSLTKSATVQAWLLSWLDQCLLRRVPQDDAQSTSALRWSILAYFATDLFQALPGTDQAQAFGMAMADTLLMILFSWAVLTLSGKATRWVQTLTALAGTGMLLSLFAMPLVLQVSRSVESGGAPGALLVSAWLLLLVWSIAVQAHIFRHALSTRYGVGVLIAILHTLLAITLLQALFTPPEV
ncbi:MAG: hypothetical protein RQ736_13860 [Thiogranum sp.]|nr:hypothetical protein [Thiogranum sp.]